MHIKKRTKFKTGNEKFVPNRQNPETFDEKSKDEDSRQRRRNKSEVCDHNQVDKLRNILQINSCQKKRNPEGFCCKRDEIEVWGLIQTPQDKTKKPIFFS